MVLTEVSQDEQGVGTLPRVRVLQTGEAQSGDPEHDGCDWIET